MEINMQIKKVAVLGAGAVGSYVIWGLSQAENLSLGVIAEGERAGRLKENRSEEHTSELQSHA